MSKVIRIETRHPETALENLNRLTGLDFQDWPESLLGSGGDAATAENGHTDYPKPRGERALPSRRWAHQGG
ncbi:MAG TPA: hypothetical protein VFX91_03090 [Alcanivorax sp.]|nr:hypothetical protein [Alcanivorax sp.]